MFLEIYFAVLAALLTSQLIGYVIFQYQWNRWLNEE